jgi:hypothetical protein
MSPDFRNKQKLCDQFVRTLNEKSQAGSMIDFEKVPYDGFRLTDQAVNYNFAHRPFDDKMIKAKQERDQFKK